MKIVENKLVCDARQLSRRAISGKSKSEVNMLTREGKSFDQKISKFNSKYNTNVKSLFVTIDDLKLAPSDVEDALK